MIKQHMLTMVINISSFMVFMLTLASYESFFSNLGLSMAFGFIFILILEINATAAAVGIVLVDVKKVLSSRSNSYVGSMGSINDYSR